MAKFKPGESGNPGGRPRVIAEIRELAREHTADAISTLAGIMTDAKATPAARVSAATALLDRGYGKPPQFIAASFNRRAVELTDEELMAIATGAELQSSAESALPPRTGSNF